MHLGKRNADRVIQMEGTRLLAYVNETYAESLFLFHRKAKECLVQGKIAAREAASWCKKEICIFMKK